MFVILLHLHYCMSCIRSILNDLSPTVVITAGQALREPLKHITSRCKKAIMKISGVLNNTLQSIRLDNLVSPYYNCYAIKKRSKQLPCLSMTYTCLSMIYQILSHKHLCCKKKNKREDKEVQVTERPKDVISLWGLEGKLYQLGCVYRTPAYVVNSFKYLYIGCKLSKDTISLANT